MCVCVALYSIFSPLFSLLLPPTASFYFFFFSMRLSSDYTTERIFSQEIDSRRKNLGSSPLLATRCCTHTRCQRAKNGCISAQKEKKDERW
jgi:hypothetical protein